MATQASNTIWLKGDGITKEGNAGGTITPGHLVMRNTTADQFVVQTATATGVVLPAFALEADFVGKGIGTNYTTGLRVQVLYPQRGAEIYALLPASAGAVVIGDGLMSNGDGALLKRTTGQLVAIALEAVDNSANAAGPVRIRVETV